MVAGENPELIEWRQRLTATDVLDSEKSAEDGSIDNDGDALDEEDDSGFGEAGVRTGVTKSETEEVEEAQQVVKYYFL